MVSHLRDYSVLDKLKLERKPVGVKFLSIRPQGIERIREKRAFCEMFKEAQENGAFYVQEEDFICVEPLLLGMKDPDPVLVSGLAGGSSGLFKEPRANRKLYQYAPKMLKHSVNYVAFSPIDSLTFDPDVTIITANVSQARSLLRADCYSSGNPWAWLYIYPVLTGKMNFTVTGLSLGMQAINVQIPEGLFLIAIPWNIMPTILENLLDENLYRSWRTNREEHFTKFNDHMAQLWQKMQD
jgi:uncharacterized protein (DUF169 family)